MNTQFSGKGNTWRGTNPTRQLEGLSQPLTRKLKDMNQKELTELYDKTNAMMNNSALQLPDGGAKLKAKLEQIKFILDDENTITNGITHKVSGLSLNDKLDFRKETVSRSNKESQPIKLLRSHHDTEQPPARTARMMSLEESMQLQESQQKDIKLANMKKRMESVRGSVASDSLADDLTLTMSRLQLDPETRILRPDDDGPSDGEDDDDANSDDPEDYGRYDDEGFEEEDQEFEDGQQYNRRV